MSRSADAGAVDEAQAALRLQYRLERQAFGLLMKDRYHLPELVSHITGRKPGEFVEAIIARREELSARLAKIGYPASGSSAKPDVAARKPARVRQFPPFRIRPQIGPELDIESIQAGLRFAAQFANLRRCPDLTLGSVNASAFRRHLWTSEPIPGTAVFWPHTMDFEPFPLETYEGDWSGSTGSRFWATIQDDNDAGFLFGTDLPSSVGIAGVLQFTLPAPACDSTVYWAAEATVRAPWSWELDVDYGWAKTDWVYCERPGGQGFPSFPSAYDWNEHGLSFFSILRQGVLDEDREDTRVLDGSFNVSAGVAPRIYLGVSVFLWAERGVINSHTMGGTDQSYFVFPWGVFYAMVPD